MKVPHILLVLLGTFGVSSSACGQATRHVLEFFSYKAQQSSVPAFPAFDNHPVFNPNLKLGDVLAEESPKLLGVIIRLVPEDDDAFSAAVGQKDVLPTGLMRKYRNGFLVDLPFTSEPTTVYIRGGLSWDLGKHSRFVFPSFSRTTGFKFSKSF